MKNIWEFTTVFGVKKASILGGDLSVAIIGDNELRVLAPMFIDNPAAPMDYATLKV